MSQPTPTARGQALRHADFATLCEALDYAATCDTGFNYFDGKDAATCDTGFNYFDGKGCASRRLSLRNASFLSQIKMRASA